MPNEEMFLNYCRSYGIENTNLDDNQLENKKYFLKMLLASQTTSTVYNSWLSSWFANLNTIEYTLNNGNILSKNNNNQQQSLGLEMPDEDKSRLDLKVSRN